MKFLAYLTKGLNDVAKKEILSKIPEASIEEKSKKYLIFKADESCITDITSLKTVDDAHILLKFKNFDEVPGTETIVESFPDESLAWARNTIEEFRDLEDDFSITISKYKNNTADLDRIEQEVSDHIEKSTGANYLQDSHSNFDIRIHLEKKNLLVSARLTEKPLYFRDYWKQGRKGSLKTSVAAALCNVPNISEGDKLVDNFCGAGTILCEGSIQGADVYGGDIDRDAVQCARKNLQEVSKESLSQVKRLDATSTDHPDNYFDVAVSNFPWGHQVDINAVKLYSKAIEEYSRILKKNGEIVILGDHPELAEKYLKKHFEQPRIEKFQLGFLGQTPTVIHATL